MLTERKRIMKFEEPKLRIIELNSEDIIQTSGEAGTESGGGENETPFLPNSLSLDTNY